MSDDQAGTPDNQEGIKVVYRTVNWQTEIETIAGPIGIHDTRESWLSRAARKAGITLWHARAMFYGNLTDPKWSIGIKVRNAADKVRLEAARGDAKRLAEIYNIAAGRLNAIDPNFHRSTIDSLVALSGQIGPDDSA